MRNFLTYSWPCFDWVELTPLSKHRALTFLPMVAKAPINTKSLFRTSYRVNMPVPPGFHLTHKKSNKPLARISEAMPILKRPRRRFPRSSRRSSRRPRAQSPSGQLSGFAGVERCGRFFTPLMSRLYAQTCRLGCNLGGRCRHAVRRCCVHPSCDDRPQGRSIDYDSVLSTPVHARGQRCRQSIRGRHQS